MSDRYPTQNQPRSKPAGGPPDSSRNGPRGTYCVHGSSGLPDGAGGGEGGGGAAWRRPAGGAPAAARPARPRAYPAPGEGGQLGEGGVQPAPPPPPAQADAVGK